MSFTVPEHYRIRTGRLGSDPSYGNNGAFRVPISTPTRRVMVYCIASDQGGWEHVSVSLFYETPRWEEMEAIRQIFWGPESTVMQLHVPRSRWIDTHPHTLHLWRPVDGVIELPPIEFV